jgi:hypothetical protein
MGRAFADVEGGILPRLAITEAAKKKQLEVAQRFPEDKEAIFSPATFAKVREGIAAEGDHARLVTEAREAKERGKNVDADWHAAGGRYR